MEFSHEDLATNETQLEIIRDVMLTSSRAGTWLTLGEIAEQTQFGEASISAQLRHLRKPRHGSYIVEKRRRAENGRAPEEPGGVSSAGFWEYQVLPRAQHAGGGGLDRDLDTPGGPIGALEQPWLLREATRA